MFGMSNRKIAKALGLDRKTVNQYIAQVQGLQIPEGIPLVQILEQLSPLVRGNRKPKPSFQFLEPYWEEIQRLITGDRTAGKEPMKAIVRLGGNSAYVRAHG